MVQSHPTKPSGKSKLIVQRKKCVFLKPSDTNGMSASSLGGVVQKKTGETVNLHKLAIYQ